MKRNNLVVFNNEAISHTQQTHKGDEKLKNLRKRKDGRWEGRQQINKKIYYAYGKTQKECLSNLKKKIKSINEDMTIPTDFYKFALYWFENFKKGNIAEKSETNYLNYINNDLIKLHIRLDELNVDILQKFINSMPPTRKREYCTMIIKQVVKKAYEYDLIPKNYGEFVSKGKINRKKVSGFSIEEQKKMLSNLKNDKFSITVYTLLLTGCRPNELQTIRKSNIKNNLILIDGTKTKNARRWIKISDFLQNLLTSQSDEIIFEKFNVTVFGRKFKEYLNSLGIDGTLYMLRHTFATNLFYLGVSDKERQSYMGHSSSVLTNDVYTDFDPSITRNDILNLYINLYPEF